MEYLNRLSIVRKVQVIFLFILLCVSASYITVFVFQSKQKTDGVLIDVAGRNRMLSQRTAAMVLLSDSPDEDRAAFAKEELRKAIVLHEQSVYVLKNGGIAPGIDPPIVLPPATGLVLPKLLELEEYLSSHKRLISVVLEQPRSFQKTDSSQHVHTAENTDVTKALVELRQRFQSGTLLRLNAELTQLYSLQASSSKNAFIAMLIFLLVVNAGILMAAYAYLRLSLRPLQGITDTIAGLAQGDLPVINASTRKDEIGQITNAVCSLSQELKKATEFARNVGDGKLDTQVVMFQGQGDLSLSLQVMRNNLNTVAIEDRKRNWTTEGLAKFSDILRSTTDMKVLGDNIISGLVRYLKANQGSLFIHEENGAAEQLKLISCFAYDRKKFMQKVVLPGEGLAGQAFLEKQTIVLREIPDQYIRITSGLGEAPPRSLVIVPLMVNDTVEGILEIASFYDFEPHQIQFIEKLGENIAATLSAARISEQTRVLLEASQQQAEELRSQEEEMRQNMEELSATQEEMSRKEKEYIDRIMRLEEQLLKSTTGVRLNGAMVHV